MDGVETMTEEEKAANIERLESFKAIEANWDSYGAPPIDHRVITEARTVLDSLDAWKVWIYPTTQAGIQFEAEKMTGTPMGIEIAIEVDEDGLFSYECGGRKKADTTQDSDETHHDRPSVIEWLKAMETA